MSKLSSAVCAAACLMSLSSPSWSAEAVRSADIAKRGLKAADFPLTKQLVPGVFAHEDLLTSAGVTFTTDSLIVVTRDGVVVVDGQDSVPQVQAMISAIKKLTPQPIKYVVIASDHVDHVGGNAAFKAAYPDVVFVSSPASQKVLEKNPNPPTETVADKRSLHLGSTDIDILNLGRGHTGGDLAVYLPQSKVLFLGELYLHQVFPAMITAYPSEWVATIKKAQGMDVSWYVPGHGFVDDMAKMRADLDESRKATELVISEAKRLRGRPDWPVPMKKIAPPPPKPIGAHMET